MVLDASSPWPGDSYPVPAIAVADDGAVLVANAAFAEELGCSRDAVTSISYNDIPLFEVLRNARRGERSRGVRPLRSGAQQCRTTPMSDGATQCR
jgi:hypothetical protein